MLDIKKLTDDFAKMISQINSFEFDCFTIEKLRQNTQWGDWSRKKGVYYFQDHEDIVYVGRALRSLGSRIYNQINSFGDPKWNEIINNKNIIVGVICLNDAVWYLSSSLEIFLIANLNPRPKFNKRIQ